MVLELWFYILMLTGLLCGVGVLGFFGARAKIRFTDVPRCEACLYDMSATPIDQPCPECGGWPRTTAAADARSHHQDSLINRACVIAPPLLTAALYLLAGGDSPSTLVKAIAGFLIGAPISLIAALLIGRARSTELAILTAGAASATLGLTFVMLRDLSALNPGHPLALCLAPVVGLGAGGWGAGLGALAIWIRDEYVARR